MNGKRAAVQPESLVSAQVGLRPMAGESTVLHAPFAPRQGAVVRSWWAKSLERAVAESAYEERLLRQGRTLARKAAVGALTLSSGQLHAAVMQDDDAFTVTLRLPVLSAESLDALVEVVSSVSGWVGALMQGDLPQDLVEAAEEMGVELMPWGGEFDASCTCEEWAQPCIHALAVLTQMTWWADADPFVLTRMRGIGREGLLVRLHDLAERPAALSSGRPGDLEADATLGDDDPDALWGDDDASVALEAAERASVMLEAFTAGDVD
jgi:uncharacterized Zn finger protein